MYKFLRSLNRFFLNQSLYPLLLSSALALSIYLGRIVISRSWSTYAILVWNLFLAWIPYLCSVWSAATQRLFPRSWWLLIVPGGLWLIFFPNAPYIMTDFLHLDQYVNAPQWYDILMLASFAWTGIFLAIVSLRTMQILIQRYLGRFVGWLFVGGAVALSGLGIYLGRFERWNSWDVLFNPKGILKDIAVQLLNPFDNLRFFGFTILFTVLLLVFYLTFIFMRRMEES
jgi:uncharacterized membrane protein